MSKTIINEWSNLSDPAILEKVGAGLQQLRLKKNITQDELSKISGLDRTTISQLENGRAATLLTLVQVLRALDELELLNVFSVEQEISPLAMAKFKKKSRRRASKKKYSKTDKEQSEW